MASFLLLCGTVSFSLMLSRTCISLLGPKPEVAAQIRKVLAAAEKDPTDAHKVDIILFFELFVTRFVCSSLLMGNRHLRSDCRVIFY